MLEIFNKIFNKVIGEKKKYRQMVARMKRLPEDYQFVYEKIQSYMWSFGTGDGYDILKIQYDLIELFETAAADGKQALEVTGNDVAAFADELLQNAQTYTESLREKLNHDVMKKLGSK